MSAPVKIWSVFSAARYIEGVLQEEFDQSFMSGGQPLMVSVDDYQALSEENARLRGWYAAVQDELVTTWCLSDENKDDPRKALADVIRWHARVALDPAVSSEAAALHAERDRLRERVEELERIVVALCPCDMTSPTPDPTCIAHGSRQ